MDLAPVYPPELLVDLDAHGRPGYTAIYALVHPVTDAIRYVGKSIDPLARLARHSKATSKGFHKVKWIAALAREGLRPRLRVLRWVPDTEWPDAERRYIALARAAGCDLTNYHPGGRGTGGYKHTAEARAKISAGKRGHKLGPLSPVQRAQRSEQSKRAWLTRPRTVSDEVRQRLSAAHRGVPLSVEHRAHVAEAHRGQKRSEQARRNMSAAQKGRTLSPEVCAAMSARRKGVRLPPQQVEKMRLRATGRTHTAEARSKISQASRQRQTPQARAEASARARERWSDPLYRAHAVAGMKAAAARRSPEQRATIATRSAVQMRRQWEDPAYRATWGTGQHTPRQRRRPQEHAAAMQLTLF